MKVVPSRDVPLTQVAALPVMIGDNGIARVLLLTSRETKRWIIPKGWPMKGRKHREAAALEAREEAGLVGRTSKEPIGEYDYMKQRKGRRDLCRVEVYLLTVEKQLTDWREKGQREARWFTFEEASQLVEESELVRLLHELRASKQFYVDNHRHSESSEFPLD